MPRVLRGDGDESIGPLKPGFLAKGNCVFACGVGLELGQPKKIVFDYPADTTLKQVILYWGLRSKQGDDEIKVNGTARVKGELIGTVPGFMDPETVPFVYRADVTQLNLVAPGHNEISISSLSITETGLVNGAEVVIIGDTGKPGSYEARDGCDFAYWKWKPPGGVTVRQRFAFAPATVARQAQMFVVVGDHKSVDQGRMRPSTLEVGVDQAPLRVIDNPLKGADGDSWDTILLDLTIPAGSSFVEAQLFSDTRTGSTLSPSSFYWLFGSLCLRGVEEPRALSISGTVYCDTNGNANLDGAEKGIAGVEVTLSCTRGGEATKRSTFTNAAGAYRFDDIAPGSDCTVAVVPSPALGDKEPTEVCPSHTNLQESVADCDFGFALPPAVGDTVFLDLNGDGAQQGSEPGLAGVKVTIVSPAGGGFPGYSADMVTDVNGKYLFHIPGVPGGATLVSTVQVDPGTGEARGKDITTPNPQDTIPLGPGGMDLARDFGFKPRTPDAKVGDTVFFDANGNARQEDGEQGLAGVKVSISSPASADFGGFNATAVTDAQGKYLFLVPGIPEGKEIVCTVSIDPNTGDARGKELTTANPQETSRLGPGGMDLDRDFGLKLGVGDALVGDTVFCDLNGNGRQDAGEPGIRDVPVSLSAPAGGGFAGANLTARTDPNGKYQIIVKGIPFGSSATAMVSIDVTSPAVAQKILTTPNPQETRPLVAGGEDRDRDFGLKPVAARVGDLVFCDSNGNGIPDAEDRGLAGVKVTITAPATGSFGGFSDTTVTDVLGKYLFTIEGIPPGTPIVATVAVDPSTGAAAGLGLTTPNPQRTAELGPGVQDLNRDFGFLCEETRVKTCLENKMAESGGCVPVRVLLSSNRPVEGFVTAVKHDPAAVTLDSISIAGTATEANVPDFTSFEVLPNGGTAGVIMDIQPPFNGNTIPAGTDLPIVVYRYCCGQVPPGSEPRTTPLRFVDDELGSPPKENVVVIGGLAIRPELCDGSITCRPGPETPGPCFLCGGTRLGADKLPVPILGAPGERVTLCFYYCSPEDNKPGHPQFDHLQGLSMALCYDCRLECIESSFRTPPDTITDALKAEYVSFQSENDPNDGDGCEMILGILVDALEPFDGRTLPPTEIPLKLGCVDLKIASDVACGTCLPVQFCDGADGRGRVPVKNLYAAENQSFAPRTVNCEVCVIGPGGFRRGDCNADSKANLPDAAAIITALFPMGSARFDPPCMDACDVNDDGRLDISDAVRLLAWLFTNGAPPLPPGPVTPGPDPTDDKLPACTGGACP